MMFLYDVWYLVVLLRRNNEVELPTQSAEKWICTGKRPVPSLAIFHHVLVVHLIPDLLTLTRTLP